MDNVELMNLMSVSKVEEYFDSILRGRLTKNLFYEQMPTTLGKGWKSFVVVDCGTAIRDYSAYGAGTVRVFLYQAPNASGVKDVAELYRLESTLNEIISESSDEHYVLSRKGFYSGYDAINDMFFNVIQLNLVII